MSYYAKLKFSLTNHARIRIKQRLKIDPSLSDLEVDIFINEKLEGLIPSYQKGLNDYYKIPQTKDLYAIVCRIDNSITTVTKMLPTKINKLL